MVKLVSSILLIYNLANCQVSVSDSIFFRFVDDDFGDVDPRERFMCLYPKFVNIDLKIGYKVKYPNPCSPNQFANFVIFIPDSSSQLQIKILNASDSTISKYEPINLRKGYYVFDSYNYLFNGYDKLESPNKQNLKNINYPILFNVDGNIERHSIHNFR